jgi:hypothetical protein
MVHGARVAEQSRRRLEEGPLACGPGVERKPALGRRQPARHGRRAGGTREPVAPRDERASPVRDRAIGVGLGHGGEGTVRLTPPEGVKQSEGAFEPLLRDFVAGGLEGYTSKPLGPLVMGVWVLGGERACGGQAGEKQGQGGSECHGVLRFGMAWPRSAGHSSRNGAGTPLARFAVRLSRRAAGEHGLPERAVPTRRSACVARQAGTRSRIARSQWR